MPSIAKRSVDEIVQEMMKLAPGAFTDVPVASARETHHLQVQISNHMRPMNLVIRTKRIGNTLRLYKIADVPVVLPAKARKFITKGHAVNLTTSTRMKVIYDAYLLGASRSELAEAFNLGRERVRQITVDYQGCVSKLPSALRPAALNEVVTPYLGAVPPKPVCLMCRGTKNPRAVICAKCQESRRVLATIGSRLRAYKRTKQRGYLSTAMWLIRKHNVKPEYLQLA